VTSVRVLTVDDHPAFRDAARALIDATPGFEVAGEVTSGEDAVGAVMRLRPDLVLMDVGLSGIDGYEATRRLRYVRPATVIVLVSASDEALEGETAMTCGAVAWVRKQDLRPSVLQELWQIHGTAHQ
jgi:two-component system, NarL family, invasion response regulator UvrY